MDFFNDTERHNSVEHMNNQEALEYLKRERSLLIREINLIYARKLYPELVNVSDEIVEAYTYTRKFLLGMLDGIIKLKESATTIERTLLLPDSFE